MPVLLILGAINVTLVAAGVFSIVPLPGLGGLGKAYQPLFIVPFILPLASYILSLVIASNHDAFNGNLQK